MSYLFENQLDFVFFNKKIDAIEITPHFHPYCKIMIPRGEGLVLKIGEGSSYQLPADSLLLLLPFVRHGISKTNPSSSIDSLSINIERLGADFLSMAYMHPIHQMMNQKTSGILFHGEVVEQAKQIFAEMKNEFRMEYLISAIQILNILSRESQYSLLAQGEEHPNHLRNIQFCTSVTSYLLEHLDTPIEIDNIASIMNMSKSSFTRQFKFFFKKPFHVYLLHKKIETACYWLFTTTMPIQEITERLGFSSPSHFIGTFKRLRHMTPSAYRKQKQYVTEQYQEYIKEDEPYQCAVPVNQKASATNKALK